MRRTRVRERTSRRLKESTGRPQTLDSLWAMSIIIQPGNGNTLYTGSPEKGNPVPADVRSDSLIVPERLDLSTVSQDSVAGSVGLAAIVREFDTPMEASLECPNGKRSLSQSLPAGAGRLHPGLVHAPGGALHGRIPFAARETFDARSL